MTIFRILLASLLAFSVSEVISKNVHVADLSDKKSPLYTYKGSVFTAVQVPGNIQKKIQKVQAQLTRSLGKSFSPAPAANLHITLQLIGPAHTQNQFNGIHGALSHAAQNSNQWNLAKHMENVKLSISDKGVVKMVLPRSDSLTALATTIRQSLHNAHIHHEKRFDFPDAAHITIGKVDAKHAKALKKLLKAGIKTKKITPGATMKAENFHVKQFALLKSNNPDPKRHYAVLSSYDL
jgi:2'-5' RNA ligase